MTAIFLTSTEFPAVLRGAFPDYHGPHFKIEAREQVAIDDDSWSGGTRNVYRGVDLATGQVGSARKEFGNPYTNPTGEHPIVTLEPGQAIVVHKMFCGKDLGLTAYVHPSNLTPMLPAPTGDGLSEDEQKALNIAGSIKSGYRQDEWRRHGLPGCYGSNHELIRSLVDKGLLTVNKAGAVAITVAGKNARRR